MRNFLKAALIALAALNLMDMGITTWLLARYGVQVESNRLVQALWAASPALFAAIKVLLSAVLICVVKRLKTARKWMYVAVVPTTAAYLAVVSWSLFLLIEVI